MSMFHQASSCHATETAIRRAITNCGRGLGHLINGLIAAVLAHFAYRANLGVLSKLSDRELKDMGLYRNQVGDGLADAAKYRTRQQQTHRA